jgi:hypothetical protein
MPRLSLLAGVLGLLLSGFETHAQQQLPTQPPVKLTLSVEQVQLIVQTLPVIGCQSVAQLIVCQKAVELLAEIKRQTGEQVK